MNKGHLAHDAQKTLADLRDHLARHDKPIAFFFGAGTSCAVRVISADTNEEESLIPHVAGLTEMAKSDAVALGEAYERAWGLIEARCKEDNQNPNVENVLSRLRVMISAAGGSDTLLGLKKDEIEKLEQSVRKTVARVVTPDLKLIPVDSPH